MLALGFGASAILLASAAAVGPVIIHLIMRSKPRRLVFPALRFVQKTHKANLSRLKLKHFLLLAMRILAILLIAVLLAQPFFRQGSVAAGSDSPAAVVLVVDDSLSMGYRYQNQPLLSRARSKMVDLIESLPAGSQMAVVRSSQPSAPASFTDDRGFLRRKISEIESRPSDQPLGPALARASGLLAEADLPRRVAVVVTDRTRHSWQDVETGTWPGDMQLVVLDASAGSGANQWFGRIDLSSPRAPVGATIMVGALLRSSGSGGRFEVRAELQGRRILRQVSQVQSGTSATTLAAQDTLQEAGVHHGRISFSPEDALPGDNQRFFTVEAFERPRVLLVRDPATIGREDETTTILTKSIAAAGTATIRTVTPGQITQETLETSRIVLLSGVSGLAVGQWQLLERFVRDGGGLWVVPGQLVTAQGYAQEAARALLPAEVRSIEGLEKPGQWQARRRQHPLIRPFAEGRNGGFRGLRFFRRLRLGVPAAETEVLVRYEDGAGALLVRRVGLGAVVLWNFSPATEFSNLVEFPQQLILTARTLSYLAGGDDLPTQLALGQSVVLTVPPRMGGATASLRRPGREDWQPLAIDPASRSVRLHPDAIGHWTVRFTTAQQRIERGFSVNLDPAESSMDRLDADQIIMLLGWQDVRFSTDAGLTGRGGGPRTRHLGAWILLALFALLVVESWFANRFYRSAGQGEAPE